MGLPRVRRQCGGSVKVDFGSLLQPYQRTSADMDAQIQRWSGMAVSLRQMRQALTRLQIGALALRTLNERLHQLARLQANR